MKTSRYQEYDSHYFMGAIHKVLFGPAFAHLEHLLKGIHRDHKRLNGCDMGFMYDDRFFPSRAGAKYDCMPQLHPELHERMEDYLALQRTFERESHTVMSWYRNMLPRARKLGELRANLMKEVLSVVTSDRAFEPLNGVTAADEVTYPLTEEVKKLQLKYIGMRFILS